jgi:hypothetical protein
MKQPQTDDWFEQGLLKRIPDDLRDSFTPEQLSALKIAFGARKWGQHPIDVRGTLKVWSWRYYFVILMGRNKRELSRAEQKTAAFVQALFLLIFLTLSTLLGLLVLYLAKSAAGIDLVPNFSLGIWGWFKTNIL